MQGIANETVGPSFQNDLLQAARDRTLAVLMATAKRLRPGMSEGDAKLILAELQTEAGAERTWHPPQVRFGENSLLSFGVPGREGVRLQENDIFFLDIGPVFAGHEGDVGRAFALGQDPEHQRCVRDVQLIWSEVRDHWKNHGVSGAELYAFATARAEALGWRLSTKKANGHRIADFPHAARQRGSIEEFRDHPAANRWILEIQIRHPERDFGAFYEDLLN